MSAMASQITSFTSVYSTAYSRRRSKKHQSSPSLAFVRGIHRSPVISPHKGPVTRKSFHLMTSSWSNCHCWHLCRITCHCFAQQIHWNIYRMTVKFDLRDISNIIKLLYTNKYPSICLKGDNKTPNNFDSYFYNIRNQGTVLTHWGRVTHICVSKTYQHWFR